MQGKFIVRSQKNWNLIGQCRPPEAKSDCKPDLFEQTILVWAYSLVQKTKADKYSSCYLFLSLSGQVVYFFEADYYCTILRYYIYSYLQKFFKALHNSQENTCVGVSF